MNPLDHKSANDAARCSERNRACIGQSRWLATLNGESNPCPMHGEDSDADDEVVFASGDGAA
jgi:hypothetical protein